LKIAHLTSAHERHDTRIFLKMARSTAAAGYEAVLVVADGQGEETKDEVLILDVGGVKGRLDRMFGATRRVFKTALQIDASLYHLHDPELLPVGLALRRRGKHVVFDAHEDLPKQILSKHYLPPIIRKWISAAAGMFERFACGRLDIVIAATPAIRDKFRSRGIEAIDINNFPMLGELQIAGPPSEKGAEVCYLGGIAAVRGIREIVDAMALCASDARLNLAGAFEQETLKAEVKKKSGWARVNELGFLSRSQIKEVLGRSAAGLVTLHPTPAYVDALPVKMFEYMSASLPVIASDFPLWREIVVGSGCGLCVDPLDPKAIAVAIDTLLENPALAREMGEKGNQAVHQRYNWAIEEKKLLDLYEQILTRSI
jgi:glycosyltransferase involved in cell wall biosynthesis